MRIILLTPNPHCFGQNDGDGAVDYNCLHIQWLKKSERMSLRKHNNEEKPFKTVSKPTGNRVKNRLATSLSFSKYTQNSGLNNLLLLVYTFSKSLTHQMYHLNHFYVCKTAQKSFCSEIYVVCLRISPTFVNRWTCALLFIIHSMCTWSSDTILLNTTVIHFAWFALSFHCRVVCSIIVFIQNMADPPHPPPHPHSPGSFLKDTVTEYRFSKDLRTDQLWSSVCWLFQCVLTLQCYYLFLQCIKATAGGAIGPSWVRAQDAPESFITKQKSHFLLNHLF